MKVEYDCLLGSGPLIISSNFQGRSWCLLISSGIQVFIKFFIYGVVLRLIYRFCSNHSAAIKQKTCQLFQRSWVILNTTGFIANNFLHTPTRLIQIIEISNYRIDKIQFRVYIYIYIYAQAVTLKMLVLLTSELLYACIVVYIEGQLVSTMLCQYSLAPNN